ncbi:MAG: hypothetical protein ABIO76_01900 [Ginsengibacter sp.]
MKRVLAFILLFFHMNVSMFLPQMPESDVYDESGNQLDDINSVVEFVLVKLGIDHHADDEDDDNGQNFHLVKIAEYCFQPVFTTNPNNTWEIKPALYGVYKESKVPDIACDIILPPPKHFG